MEYDIYLTPCNINKISEVNIMSLINKTFQILTIVLFALPL